MRHLYRSKKKVTCNDETYDVVWFKTEMFKRWEKKVEVNEVGYESIMLEHEEVDE